MNSSRNKSSKNQTPEEVTKNSLQQQTNSDNYFFTRPATRSSSVFYKLLLVSLLIIFCTILLTYFNLTYYQNPPFKPQNQPSATPTSTLENQKHQTVKNKPELTSGWQSYTDNQQSISFKYPEKLTLTQQKNKIILSHSIPYENTGDCDMQGGPYIYPTLEDFNISIEAVDQVDPLPYVDGEYTVGKLQGTWAYLGAEGCGYTTYHFPLKDSKTLVIQRASIQAFTGISTAWDIDKILSTPGVITKTESETIFREILSTIRILDSDDEQLIIKQLCNQKYFEGYPAAVLSCENERYSISPPRYIMDAPSSIVDKDFNELAVCGGMPYPGKITNQLCNIECDYTNLCDNVIIDCSSLTDTARDQCLFENYIRTQNPQYCSQITETYYKNRCPDK